MPEQDKRQETPEFDISKASETLAEKRLDRATKEAAEKTGRTEQHYDQDHSIFTK